MTMDLKKNTRDLNYLTTIKGVHVAEEIKSRVEEKVFEVYWVHLPEHVDIRSQGYVGITCQGTSVRFSKHRSDATNGDKEWLFHRAIRKHGYKNLVVETVLVGDYEYALMIENKLRPETFIGWNTCEGGGAGFLEGLEKIHSNPKFPKMRSDHMYSAWQDEEYANKMLKSRKNYFNNTPPWRREGNAVNHFAWSMSGIYYILYSQLGWGNEKISNYLMVNSGSMSRVWDYISKNNWNPLEDDDYPDLYPIPTFEEIVEVYGDPEQYHISWRRKDSSAAWSMADKLYDLYHSGTVIADLARYAGVTWHQMHKMYRKFQNGWNPHKDLRWQVDFKGYKHEH